MLMVASLTTLLVVGVASGCTTDEDCSLLGMLSLFRKVWLAIWLAICLQKLYVLNQVFVSDMFANAILDGAVRTAVCSTCCPSCGVVDTT
jgi:hypothetical protein